MGPTSVSFMARKICLNQLISQSLNRRLQLRPNELRWAPRTMKASPAPPRLLIFMLRLQVTESRHVGIASGLMTQRSIGAKLCKQPTLLFARTVLHKSSDYGKNFREQTGCACTARRLKLSARRLFHSRSRTQLQ